MSSGQNKKVNSIARKIGSLLKRKKLRVFTFANFCLVIACFIVYITTLEYAATGTVAGNSHRLEVDFQTLEQLRDGKRNEVERYNYSVLDYYWDNLDKVDDVLDYRAVEYVAQEEGSAAEPVIVFELPVLLEIIIMLLTLIALKIAEHIICLISAAFERRRIRYIMRPIDDIAAKADELARLEFDETKYHNLEEKIAELDPEDSLPVTQGDKDLESLENAINNLLMRMREANRQQARFVNDASHELRTPIAVIEGYANMLVRWGREDEKVLDESIQAIQHESSHMKYLVEQLLFLARGDSGKTVLKPEDISLTDMMREIYEESLMIDETHVYKFNSVEGEDIRLTCDPALVKQAVRILVDNAAKYTAERDEIILGVGSDEAGHPYLQVEDTGIGMAEADVTHMFERFYRSDEVRSYQGTGLGLSIAKWIIDKHNGHFEVTSREGIGTRIRVVL